jgi:hypothetical protein
MAALSAGNVAVNVMVPVNNPIKTDIITIQAVSSRDPSRVVTLRIFVSVGTQLYLPIMLKK